MSGYAGSPDRFCYENGTWSSVVIEPCGLLPDTPTNLTITNIEDTSVSFDWVAVSEVNSYNIYVSSNDYNFFIVNSGNFDHFHFLLIITPLSLLIIVFLKVEAFILLALLSQLWI